MGSYSFRNGWVQACNSVLRGGTSRHPSQVIATIARPRVGALMTRPLPSLQSRLQSGGWVVHSWHWNHPMGFMAL